MSTRTYIEINHDVADPEKWNEDDLAALGNLIRSGYPDFPQHLKRMGITVVYQRHHSDPCPCQAQAEHWLKAMDGNDRYHLALRAVR